MYIVKCSTTRQNMQWKMPTNDPIQLVSDQNSWGNSTKL